MLITSAHAAASIRRVWRSAKTPKTPKTPKNPNHPNHRPAQQAQGLELERTVAALVARPAEEDARLGREPRVRELELSAVGAERTLLSQWRKAGGAHRKGRDALRGAPTRPRATPTRASTPPKPRGAAPLGVGRAPAPPRLLRAIARTTVKFGRESSRCSSLLVRARRGGAAGLRPSATREPSSRRPPLENRPKPPKPTNQTKQNETNHHRVAAARTSALTASWYHCHLLRRWRVRRWPKRWPPPPDLVGARAQPCCQGGARRARARARRAVRDTPPPARPLEHCGDGRAPRDGREGGTQRAPQVVRETPNTKKKQKPPQKQDSSGHKRKQGTREQKGRAVCSRTRLPVVTRRLRVVVKTPDPYVPCHL